MSDPSADDARISRLPHRLLALLTLSLAVAAVASCGDETAPTTAESIGFNHNRDTYALPLDQIRAIDDGTIGYAANLLTQDCMEAAGFPWPIPTFEPNVRPPATWNATGRRLFDVEIAQRFGYHITPPADTEQAQQLALNSRTLAPAEERQLKRCRTLVDKRISAPDTRLIDSLAGAAYDSALADARTIAAARRWRDCLAREGISDLPEMPNRMPSPSLAQRFRLGHANSSHRPRRSSLRPQMRNAASRPATQRFSTRRRLSISSSCSRATGMRSNELVRRQDALLDAPARSCPNTARKSRDGPTVDSCDRWWPRRIPRHRLVCGAHLRVAHAAASTRAATCPEAHRGASDGRLAGRRDHGEGTYRPGRS